jgi:hypothetical protein
VGKEGRVEPVPRSVASKLQKAKYLREKYQQRRASGLCVWCGEVSAVSGRSKCAAHLHQSNANNRRTEKPRTKEERKAYWDALTREVLAAYGDSCKCCGESEPLLLTIDHIANDGKQHRTEVGGSHSFYLWLRRNKYPQDRFQCLCFSCNMGKFRNGGVCPHVTSASKLFLVA